jgi:hypothetical protein
VCATVRQQTEPPVGSPLWLARVRGGSGSEWRERDLSQEDLDELRAIPGNDRLPATAAEHRAMLFSLNRPDLGGVEWLWDHIKRAGPKGWMRMGIARYGAKFRNSADLDTGLVVHVDGRWYGDHRWIHISASGSRTTPSWEQMCEVKRAFVGEDTYAYAVMPPQQFYVNLQPWLLHWWVPLDGTTLPEFTMGYGLL